MADRNVYDCSSSLEDFSTKLVSKLLKFTHYTTSFPRRKENAPGFPGDKQGSLGARDLLTNLMVQWEKVRQSEMAVQSLRKQLWHLKSGWSFEIPNTVHDIQT